jgi:hypothetical protein
VYRKFYNLNELKKIIQKLLNDGRKKMDLEDLLFEIGYDPLDANEFHIKNIKHRIRYEREK